MEHMEHQASQEATKEETKTESTPSETTPSPKRKFKPSKRATTAAGLILIVLIILATLYQFRSVFIAATVNGSPVSRLTVVKELEKRSGKSALDEIITKKLIADEAKAKGISVNKEEIDAEIKKIEEQVAKQGGVTFTDMLKEQGLTEKDVREQIMIRKQLEKLLAEKTQVTDEEVNQFLSTRKAPPTEGMSSEDLFNQTKEGLKQQKFNQEAGQWVEELRTKADIQYFVNY